MRHPCTCTHAPYSTPAPRPCARRHWRMRRRPPPLLPLAPLSSLHRPRWWQIRSTNQRRGEWSLPRYSVRGRPGRAPRPTERWWLRTRTRLQRSTRSQLGAVAGLGAARAIKFLPMASWVTQCMPWDTEPIRRCTCGRRRGRGCGRTRTCPSPCKLRRGSKAVYFTLRGEPPTSTLSQAPNPTPGPNDITCEEWGEAILGEGDLLDGVE